MEAMVNRMNDAQQQKLQLWLQGKIRQDLKLGPVDSVEALASLWALLKSSADDMEQGIVQWDTALDLITATPIPPNTHPQSGTNLTGSACIPARICRGPPPSLGL